MSSQAIVHKFVPGKKEAELVLGRGGRKFATLVVEGTKMVARLPNGSTVPADGLRAEDLVPGVDPAQLRLAIKFAKTVLLD